ncbi:MAG: PepSY domain-containing protein [Pseudomonadota bacterium]
MKQFRLCILAPMAALAAVSLAVPAAAEAPADRSYYGGQAKQRDDQDDARREMRAGNQLSLREIERRVLPQMGDAEYLGPTYDKASHAYRLKFIENGRVKYVDVDARTGKIINRSR